MIYWDNMDSNGGRGDWTYSRDLKPMALNLNDLSGLWNDLSGLLEYCADVCRHSKDCNAVKAEQNYRVGYKKWECAFNHDGFKWSEFECYGSTCNDSYSYNDFMSNKLAIFKDYYEEIIRTFLSKPLMELSVVLMKKPKESAMRQALVLGTSTT